jgi:imidazolonepropionase-like amidohydrolase
MRIWLSIGISLVLWCGEAFAQIPNSGDCLVAFVHATVIDGTGAAAKPNETVLVCGDRIAAVGSSGGVAIPRGARTIDATGQFLIPGLWDAHIHTRYEGIDHLRLLIANGITSARNMSGPWEHLRQLLAWREQIKKGERIGPRLLTAGPILDGPPSIRPTNLVVTNADESRQAVRRMKADGADFVKVVDLLSRDSYFAISGEAKAQGLPFVGHVPIDISPSEASDAGQLSIEHLDAILWASSTQEEEIRGRLQARPKTGVPAPYPVSAKFLFDSFSAAKLGALADRLKQNQTSVVPTLSLYWSRFDQRSNHSIVASADRLRYVPPSYLELWKRRQPPVSEEDQRLQLDNCLMAVRELHKRGVTILPGTDVGVSYQLPGFALHDELNLLVKAGLSTMEALQAATVKPARALRLMDQGTIEPGMGADLVLLEANPLENIDNTRKIRTVVAAGRVFERKELDTMLSDIQRAASNWAGVPTR